MTKKEKPLDVDIWMPHMVSEWLTSEVTFAMNNRQRGSFMQMLSHAWKQKASLPNDRALLAKYGDEPAEWLFDTPEGQQVLAQWPVGEDGRRRCAWQAERYDEALANRTDARKRAQDAANKRWAGERGQLELAVGEPEQSTGNAGAFPPLSPSPSSSPSPVSSAGNGAGVAAVIERWPTVGEWLSTEPRRDLLTYLADTIAKLHGAKAFAVTFVPLINFALQDGRKPEHVEAGLRDWLGHDEKLNPNRLRAFLAGATRSARAVASIDSATSSPRRATENRPARSSKLFDA